MIKIEYESYLKLLASQIILEVLNKASKINELDSNSNSTTTTTITNNNNNEKKNQNFAWDIDFSQQYYKNDISLKFKLKKFINVHRWYCISRPQYKYSCGISSLVSCWNYLFSRLGHGKLPILTQEKALEILGFKEPFNEIRFGPFTGNATLMKWFERLNLYFKVTGSSRYLYKPKGKMSTSGISESDGKTLLKEGLESNDKAFIYHCYNHYCCPIGFEDEAMNSDPLIDQIYEENEIMEKTEWFLVADTSRKFQTIHCFKWEDINKDLNMQNPEYLNIRHLEMGMLKYENNKIKSGGNLHCLILFQKN